jgi:Protein of unknown function (DUF1173).
MASVWIVQAATLQPIRILERAVSLYPENRNTKDTQELLATLHTNHYWLLCGCKKPDARMFVRQVNENTYTLVNHHEHGIHDDHCPLRTDVKGEAADRQEPTAVDGGAASLKQNEYRLLPAYKKIDLLGVNDLEMDIPPDDEKNLVDGLEVQPPAKKQKSDKSPAERIDFLYRLMWQLIDDSFATHRHHRQKVSPGSLQKKLREATFRVKLKDFDDTLRNYTYTGAEGLGFLFNKIKSAHRANPGIRHQYLFLSVISKYQYNEIGATVYDLDGTAITIGAAKKAPLILNHMSSDSGPFLLAAVYGFNNPYDESPMILKWALQPIASKDVLLPVTNWHERLIVLEMVKNLDALELQADARYKFWIHKPVLPVQDPLTGMWLHPAITLMAKDLRGERCRVAYRLSADEDNIEAFRRTFDHVHTLQYSEPSILEASCREMFLIGRGVIDQHYRKLDRELADQEALEISRHYETRMVQREQEIIDGQKVS